MVILNSSSFSIEFRPQAQLTKTQEEPKKPTLFLTENQKRVLELIREDESITHVILSEKLGLSEKSIYFIIKKLKESSLIERIGGDKIGKWRLTER
jgi:predicted HTH transcriptional regulator